MDRRYWEQEYRGTGIKNKGIIHAGKQEYHVSCRTGYWYPKRRAGICAECAGRKNKRGIVRLKMPFVFFLPRFHPAPAQALPVPFLIIPTQNRQKYRTRHNRKWCEMGAMVPVALWPSCEDRNRRRYRFEISVRPFDFCFVLLHLLPCVVSNYLLHAFMDVSTESSSMTGMGSFPP